MATYLTGTRETVDFLRRVTDKLNKANGCISSEELWNGVQWYVVKILIQMCFSNLFNSEPTDVQHSNPTVARQGFRQMEGFLDALESLASTFKSHIALVRARVHAPQLTLESLPNEITLNILEYAGLSKGENKMSKLGLKSLLRYSHICSRFRDFILSLHSLWALVELDLDLPAQVIDTIARGSGTLGLNVFVYADWNKGFGCFDKDGSDEDGDSSVIRSKKRTGLRYSSVRSALDAIFKYCHRWSNANFVVRDEQSAQYILENTSYSDLVLSSIRTLRVVGDSNDYWCDFCYDWNMPHLEELSWGGSSIFKYSRAFSLPDWLPTTAPKLSLCSLILPKTNWTDLVGFLTCTPGLIRLEIIVDADSNADEPTEHQVAYLPNLEHLNLRFLSPSTADGVAQLLGALRYPRLDHLTLKTVLLDSYLGLTEHMHDCCPSLRSITLDIAWVDDRRTVQKAYFDDILRSLPSTIEKIALGNCDSLLCSSKSKVIGRAGPHTSYSHLKELDLVYCRAPKEEDFYTNLSAILKRHSVILDRFRPCTYPKAAGDDAMAVLRRAGVLVDSSWT